MEVTFQGTYGRDELATGLKMMGGRRRKLVLAVLAGYALLMVFLALADRVSGTGSGVGVAVPIMVVMVLAVVMLIVMPRLQAARLARGPLYQSQQTGRADEEGIEVESPLVHSRTKWEAYTHHRVSETGVVLFQSQATATIIPRSFFADEADWSLFRELVRRRVAPELGGRVPPGPPPVPPPQADGPPFVPDGPDRPDRP